MMYMYCNVDLHSIYPIYLHTSMVYCSYLHIYIFCCFVQLLDGPLIVFGYHILLIYKFCSLMDENKWILRAIE